MAEDIEKRTGQYIAIRDTLKRLEAEYEQKKKPLLELQEKVAGKIREFMETNNITDNLKTTAGTCYLSTRYTATVQDGEAFMKFVKAGNWDMIERRANATVVKDYVKKHNTLPAGCNLNAIQTLGVRRPTGKKSD